MDSAAAAKVANYTHKSNGRFPSLYESTCYKLSINVSVWRSNAVVWSSRVTMGGWDSRCVLAVSWLWVGVGWLVAQIAGGSVVQPISRQPKAWFK